MAKDWEVRLLDILKYCQTLDSNSADFISGTGPVAEL
jgi:hypothetical protein